MSVEPRIYAVTVNHNTSHFVELMARTLLLTNDLASLDFSPVVLDNGSDDEHREMLASFLSAHDILLVQTAFDAGVAAEKHGLALEAFVRDHPDCTHYLFLDSDMWFFEPDTIPTMIEELRAAGPDVFANQARIAGYYAGRTIEGRDGIPATSLGDDQPGWPLVFQDRQFANKVAPRCSPVCSLIANTALFRDVVERFGLSPVVRFRVGEAIFYDTFGLMTNVMASHRQRFIVSSKTVNHFTQASYVLEHRGVKDRDCLRMLDELRAGRGLELAIFRESEWVRKQRQQSTSDDMQV